MDSSIGGKLGRGLFARSRTVTWMQYEIWVAIVSKFHYFNVICRLAKHGSCRNSFCIVLLREEHTQGAFFWKIHITPASAPVRIERARCFPSADSCVHRNYVCFVYYIWTAEQTRHPSWQALKSWKGFGSGCALCAFVTVIPLKWWWDRLYRYTILISDDS